MNYTRKEQVLPSRIGWRNLVTEITLQKSQKGEQMSEKSFIDKCLDGEAFLSELDDYIDYWHKNTTEMSLREFLGLTPCEYEAWGKSSDHIFQDILRSRREN